MSNRSAPRWRRIARKAKNDRLSRWASRPLAEQLEARMLLSQVQWTGKAGDNQWTTPGNWSDNALPGSADDVMIELSTNPTIQLSFGTQSVHSVTSTDPLNLTGGTLEIGTSLQSSANISLAGATIEGGTITETGSATVSLSAGTLSGVTIAAGTTLATAIGSTIDITGGMTLNGTIDLGPAGTAVSTLAFQGTQTLGGTGTVVLGGGNTTNTIESQHQSVSNPATLTIGSGVTIDGGSGLVTGTYAGDSVINEGTGNANMAGSSITVSGNATGLLTNNGTLEATAGTINVAAQYLPELQSMGQRRHARCLGDGHAEPEWFVHDGCDWHAFASRRRGHCEPRWVSRQHWCHARLERRHGKLESRRWHDHRRDNHRHCSELARSHSVKRHLLGRHHPCRQRLRCA